MISEPILIVDDEIEMRKALKEALEAQGYSTEDADGAESALARLKEKHYPVVLTDLNMPGGLSGLDLIAAINQRDPKTLCVVITAFATTDAAVTALKRGAYDFIQKPFKLSDLENVLDRALDHARLLDHLAAYQKELEAKILHRTKDLNHFFDEALSLCDLSLEAQTHGDIDSLLAYLQIRWKPDGIACYAMGPGGTFSCLAQRGSRQFPLHIKKEGFNFGYEEDYWIPLGAAGRLYLGFLERSSFNPSESTFVLLTRHLELGLRAILLRCGRTSTWGAWPMEDDPNH